MTFPTATTTTTTTSASPPTKQQFSSTSTPQTSATTTATAKPISRRVNGKNWHEAKAPFRKTPGLTSWAKRSKQREEAAATKKLERELKEEKAADRSAWIAGIKEKRARKEEKERFERMEERMHRKRVERVKRREKRNKLLGK